MQILLEMDEAWSLMTTVTSFVIDRGGISQDGKQAVRRWRSGLDPGSAAMGQLAEAMNRALGGYIEEKTTRQLRKKGRYGTTRDRRR
jgi:hypothetical protein